MKSLEQLIDSVFYIMAASHFCIDYRKLQKAEEEEYFELVN
ncbi:hypothetical protein [Lysinibacillus sp. BPa_S21]|nr:hypothetical protein [Lysinibacillus sp. BPa_S21]